MSAYDLLIYIYIYMIIVIPNDSHHHELSYHIIIIIIMRVAKIPPTSPALFWFGLGIPI